MNEGVRTGGCIGSCWGNRREGDHWGDLDVDEWIIFFYYIYIYICIFILHAPLL
jgi:hypothetical protein